MTLDSVRVRVKGGRVHDARPRLSGFRAVCGRRLRSAIAVPRDTPITCRDCVKVRDG